MSRPAGEIRAALLEVPRTHGPCNLHELVARSQVGYGAALYTVKNLVRSGCLVKVGVERVAHAKRWVAVYGLPEPTGDGVDAPEPHADRALDVALAGWR